MVHGVVVDVVTHFEHRLGEGGGFRPAEAHALVAGHVHDQAAGPEGGQVLGAQVGQRRVGVLQRAVDHDVALGEERRQRHAPALGDDLAQERRLAVVVELRDPDRVDGRANRGNTAVGQHLHVVDTVGVQRRHGAAGGGAEADHDGAQPAAVVSGGTGQRQGMQHGAVAGELVVLVEDMQAEAAVAGPVVHGLEGDQREFLVDRQLGDGPVLDAVRPAPEDLPVAEFGQVLGLRLGQEDDVGVRQQLLSRRDAPHEGRELGVGHGRSARRSLPRGSTGPGSPARCGPGAGGGSGGAARPVCVCWRGCRG